MSNKAKYHVSRAESFLRLAKWFVENDDPAAAVRAIIMAISRLHMAEKDR